MEPLQMLGVIYEEQALCLLSTESKMTIQDKINDCMRISGDLMNAVNNNL